MKKVAEGPGVTSGAGLLAAPLCEHATADISPESTIYHKKERRIQERNEREERKGKEREERRGLKRKERGKRGKEDRREMKERIGVKGKGEGEERGKFNDFSGKRIILAQSCYLCKGDGFKSFLF